MVYIVCVASERQKGDSSMERSVKWLHWPLPEYRPPDIIATSPGAVFDKIRLMYLATSATVESEPKSGRHEITITTEFGGTREYLFRFEMSNYRNGGGR